MDATLKIPFVSYEAVMKPDTSFIIMLKNRICPHFQLVTLSSAILFICTAVFVVSRILFKPYGYDLFLQHPKQLDKFAMDIELIESNRLYYYQVFTSIFLHQSYVGLLNVLLWGLFVFYELQYCWPTGMILAVVGGVAANSMQIATTDGIVMSLNGVISSAVGIMLGGVILHCSYLKATTGDAFCMICVSIIFVVAMTVMSGMDALLQLFALTFGLLLGLGFYPRGAEAQMNETISKLLKLFSVGFVLLAVVMGLIG